MYARGQAVYSSARRYALSTTMSLSCELGDERVDLPRPLSAPVALGGIVEPGPVDAVQHELPKVLRTESHVLGHRHIVAGRICPEHRRVVAVDHDLQPPPHHLTDRVAGQILTEVHPRRRPRAAREDHALVSTPLGDPLVLDHVVPVVDALAPQEDKARLDVAGRITNTHVR